MSEEFARYPFVRDFEHYGEMVAGIDKSIELVVKPGAKEEGIHACFYCDGGFKPHPPMAGWGIHGYFWIDVEPKQGSGCGDAITKIGYAKKADNAKTVTPVGYMDGCGAIVNGTNNSAEAEAVIIGLMAALAGGVRSAAFFCDSKYVLSGCTERLEKMRASDFTDYQTRQPIPNADRWRIISSLLKSCEEYKIELSWNWVKGHSDYLGNIKADALASRGILQGRNGHYAEDILILPGKGYWNPTADYDRFLNESRWFFQLENQPREQATFIDAAGDIIPAKHTYYLGNSALDDMDHGVAKGDANFAVVRMPNKDPVLAAVEARSKQLRSVHMDEIVVGRLDVLFNPSIYTSIQHSGVAFLHQKNPRRLDLWATDKVAMTQEMSPPRKAHIAVCAFRELETLLEQCEQILSGYQGHPVVTLTEITNCIYETQSAGKKPSMKISSAVDKGDGFVVVPAHNPISGQVEDLSLTIGIDTPKRNMMAAIAIDAPKVYVVTWKESDRAYRYATLVQAGDRIGIWAAVYSNFRFIAKPQ